MFTAVLVGDSQLIARLQSMPERVRRGLVRGVLKAARDLQRHVQQDKLSGQVLHRRTGNLRSSINVKMEEDAKGVFASVGTNVVYAAIHEYGGDIPIRRALGSAKKGARQLKSGGVIHMPERSYLRSALRDYEERIKRTMEESVAEALHEGA